MDVATLIDLLVNAGSTGILAWIAITRMDRVIDLVQARNDGAAKVQREQHDSFRGVLDASMRRIDHATERLVRLEQNNYDAHGTMLRELRDLRRGAPLSGENLD